MKKITIILTALYFSVFMFFRAFLYFTKEENYLFKEPLLFGGIILGLTALLFILMIFFILKYLFSDDKEEIRGKKFPDGLWMDECIIKRGEVDLSAKISYLVFVYIFSIFILIGGFWSSLSFILLVLLMLIVYKMDLYFSNVQPTQITNKGIFYSELSFPKMKDRNNILIKSEDIEKIVVGEWGEINKDIKIAGTFFKVLSYLPVKNYSGRAHISQASSVHKTVVCKIFIRNQKNVTIGINDVSGFIDACRNIGIEVKKIDSEYQK